MTTEIFFYKLRTVGNYLAKHYEIIYRIIRYKTALMIIVMIIIRTRSSIPSASLAHIGEKQLRENNDDIAMMIATRHTRSSIPNASLAHKGRANYGERDDGDGGYQTHTFVDPRKKYASLALKGRAIF